jgi:hypothetical protein
VYPDRFLVARTVGARTSGGDALSAGFSTRSTRMLRGASIAISTRERLARKIVTSTSAPIRKLSPMRRAMTSMVGSA